jgi:DNA-binding XRE family transcriptional regulator
MMKTKKTKRTASAVTILHNRYYKGRPDRIESLREEYLNSRLSRAIYQLRKAANLTQAQLASKIGTHASAISRLEDADYNGHSLSTLTKIVAVFSGVLEIRVVPASGKKGTLLMPNGQKMNLRQLVV